MKQHKKLVILLIVLALLLTGFLVIRSKAKEAMAALTELTEETAFVERRSIQSSISSTGEIISDNTRNIVAELTGYEVLAVNVAVGDIVAEGDVLCTFDTGDLEDSLEDAEDALDAAKTQSRVSVNNAERALELAIETKNYQIETAARNVITAHDAYERAADSYEELRSQARDAKDAVDAAKAELDSIPATPEGSPEYAQYIAAQADYQAKLEAYNAFAPDETLDEAANAANQQALFAAMNDAAGALSAAEAALNSLNIEARRAAAEAAYAAADKAYATIKASRSSAENAKDSAWTALQNAQAAYDYTVASQQTAYQNSKDAVRSAEAGAGVATIQQENSVDTLSEQIEKGALTADIGGTITAVNIKEGERYAGGAIVTIQDTDALVVVAEIDEYDIADIALGMKAVFKTDATRDEQLTGEVIFISPTPTPGSDVTYQVKVRIDSDTDRLRIGMNAKLNIILEETANVLTVPYDAIQQDENGSDVIYAVEHTENGGVIKTAIPVTVGVEGDYYVEVSGDIREGMEVSLPTDKFFDLAAIEEEMMASMGG
ncbi:MAG: HlyD family efflux transporter periplasmic adaptor subunit [Clostridia bacterium]|nr:HlyD family efflux transporter periplasmic adaptor subunit [Clostridia bacterium]